MELDFDTDKLFDKKIPELTLKDIYHIVAYIKLLEENVDFYKEQEKTNEQYYRQNQKEISQEFRKLYAFLKSVLTEDHLKKFNEIREDTENLCNYTLEWDENA